MFWIRAGLYGITLTDWLTAGPALAAAERGERPSRGRGPTGQRDKKPAARRSRSRKAPGQR